MEKENKTALMEVKSSFPSVPDEHINTIKTLCQPIFFNEDRNDDLFRSSHLVQQIIRLGSLPRISRNNLPQ